MQLSEVAGGHSGCHGGHCPTIYETETGSFVIQGYTVTEETNADLGPGESLVEIPASLLQGLIARS